MARTVPPDEVSAEILEKAVGAARSEGRRLWSRARIVLSCSVAGMALIAVRGIIAVAAPAPAASLAHVVGLATAWAMCVGGLVFGVRASKRLWQLTRDLQALEMARDPLEHDDAPRVEIHPYRTHDGSERPVVVVRTDCLERLLRKDEPTTRPRQLIDMVQRTAALGVVLALATFVLFLGGGRSEQPRRWTFLEDAADPQSLGFRAGSDRGGAWAIEDQAGATGARALVNRVGEQHGPPATLVVSSFSARDLRATTRCKAMAGMDEACGVVFRFVNGDNYHVARLQMRQRRIELAATVAGEERALGSSEARLAPDVWQELAVEARGDSLRIFWNGRKLIDAVDPIPGRHGSGGLWVPAGCEGYFDEFSIEPFATSPQALELLPLIRKGAS